MKRVMAILAVAVVCELAVPAYADPIFLSEGGEVNSWTTGLFNESGSSTNYTHFQFQIDRTLYPSTTTFEVDNSVLSSGWSTASSTSDWLIGNYTGGGGPQASMNFTLVFNDPVAFTGIFYQFFSGSTMVENGYFFTKNPPMGIPSEFPAGNGWGYTRTVQSEYGLIETAPAVPSPAGIIPLVGLGFMGLLGLVWRRRQAAA